MTGAIDTDDKAVLATYARARRKCGIGLARLKENGPKEYDAFLRVALFFASDGAQAHSFSPDALCAFLTTFLRGEGSWVKAEAPELLGQSLGLARWGHQCHRVAPACEFSGTGGSHSAA